MAKYELSDQAASHIRVLLGEARHEHQTTANALATMPEKIALHRYHADQVKVINEALASLQSPLESTNTPIGGSE